MSKNKTHMISNYRRIILTEINRILCGVGFICLHGRIGGNKRHFERCFRPDDFVMTKQNSHDK